MHASQLPQEIIEINPRKKGKSICRIHFSFKFNEFGIIYESKVLRVDNGVNSGPPYAHKEKFGITCMITFLPNGLVMVSSNFWDSWKAFMKERDEYFDLYWGEKDPPVTLSLSRSRGYQTAEYMERTSWLNQ